MLPIQLFELVLRYLDERDLLHLALTSKELLECIRSKYLKYPQNKTTSTFWRQIKNKNWSAKKITMTQKDSHLAVYMSKRTESYPAIWLEMSITKSAIFRRYYQKLCWNPKSTRMSYYIPCIPTDASISVSGFVNSPNSITYKIGDYIIQKGCQLTPDYIMYRDMKCRFAELRIRNFARI